MGVFKIAILVVIMSCGTIYGSPVEPRCFSKYDFEEKVLEKTIRTELTMKDYMEKLENGLANIAAYQRIIEETKTRLEQTAVDLKQASDDHMKAQTTMLEEKVSGLENASAERLKLLEEKASQIKDYQAIPTISFNVRGAADTAPSRYQVIKFQHVISNIGDAYDVASGKFTAPVNGTYLFGAQVCSSHNNYGIFQIAVDTRDNIILVIADRDQTTSTGSTSGTSVTYLSSGQKVWVQNQSSTTLYDHATRCWNQFTGTLIHI